MSALLALRCPFMSVSLGQTPVLCFDPFTDLSLRSAHVATVSGLSVNARFVLDLLHRLIKTRYKSPKSLSHFCRVLVAYRLFNSSLPPKLQLSILTSRPFKNKSSTPGSPCYLSHLHMPSPPYSPSPPSSTTLLHLLPTYQWPDKPPLQPQPLQPQPPQHRQQQTPTAQP